MLQIMLQLAKAMHSSDRSSATSLRSRGLIKGGLIKGVDAKRQARPQPANLSRTMRPPGEHRRISSRSTPRDAWARETPLMHSDPMAPVGCGRLTASRQALGGHLDASRWPGHV